MITVSSMTTAEAGRHSRETITCLWDAGMKELKREDKFPELGRGGNSQLVIFQER